MPSRRLLAVVGGVAAGLALAAAAQKAATPRDESAKNDDKRGKDIYKKHCEICHNAEAEAMKMAPGLRKIYKRGKYAGGRKVDDASMRAWIEKGSPKMPPFRETLNDSQITELIAYIRTL